MFRTDALRQPRLDPLWSEPFPALGVFMVLALGSGLCLENRRVAVTLCDAEDPTEASCLARMPGILSEISRTDGKSLKERVWLGATGLARRLMEQRLRRRYRHILENFTCP
jgi:hypothetical protein